MTKEKMMEMVNTLEAMLARSEERQRILKEMIAESTAEVEALEAKLAAIEEQTARSTFLIQKRRTYVRAGPSRGVCPGRRKRQRACMDEKKIKKV